jgi:hypothetical protein
LQKILAEHGVPRSLADAQVHDAIAGAQAAAHEQRTKAVVIEGAPRAIPVPFPSPADWRHCPIYFVILDRFNNPTLPPS